MLVLDICRDSKSLYRDSLKIVLLFASINSFSRNKKHVKRVPLMEDVEAVINEINDEEKY